MFDYESRNVHSKQLNSTSNCKIVRYESNVQLFESKSEDEECALLAHIDKTAKGYEVSADEGSLWHIVKHMKNDRSSGAVLSEGDILKLGRVCLRVKTLKPAESSETSPLTQDDSDDNIEIPTETETCRVCFSDENDSENPLIAPCMCAGTVKFIHLNCCLLYTSDAADE